MYFCINPLFFNLVNSMMRFIFSFVLVSISTFSTCFAASIEIETKMEVPNFNFYIDSVFLTQNEKYTIGYKFKHTKLDPFELQGGRRIDNVLDNLFKQSFPETENKRHLIVKVNRILFNTFDLTSEFGANITFIEKREGKYYDLGTVAVAWVNENSLPNSLSAKKRGENLVINLSLFFEEFLEQLKNSGSDSGALIKVEQLSEKKEISSDSFPVLDQSTDFSKGIVLSFEDFLEGKIVKEENLNLERIDQKKSDAPILKVNSKLFSQDQIWGVYDGEYFYINENGNYYQLNLTNNEFILHGPSTSQGFHDRKSLFFSVGTMTALTVGLSPQMPFGQALLIAMVSGVLVDFGTSAILNKRKEYVYYKVDLLTGLVHQIER